jgi:hypothetical protein
MPQRLPILAVGLLSSLLSLPATAVAQGSLDVAEARYQQASRETYHAQKAFDLAVARTREAGKAYQTALDEQRAASRLLADADVTGPRAADKVRQAERALDAERERVAPQYAPVESAAAEHRKAVDGAIAQVPEWVAVRDSVAKAEAAYDAAVENGFANLAESDETYLGLLAESWDAEDEAVALRDTPNADTNKLIEATQAWMASLDALEQYESEKLNADPAIRVAAEALGREDDNQQGVRERLAKGVANNPDVERTAAALAAAENAFSAHGGNLRRLQADLDVQRAELARLDQVAASARERLARVEPKLQPMADELAKLDEAARRAQDELAAAQGIEQRALQEREQLAADIARDTYVVEPPPVYVETPVYIDNATTIYYPPISPHKHYGHGHDRDQGGYYGRDSDRGKGGYYGRDSDRGNDRGRDSDRGDDRGTRRDDGTDASRGRDQGGGVPSRGEPTRGEGNKTPSRSPANPPDPKPTPRPHGDDDATARRKQEEAKAAERHRREDAAAGAAQQQKKASDSAAQAAAARQREESSRAAAQRQEESNRRQQQQSEAAARQQQQQQERKQRESSSSSSGSSSSGSSSSSGDRGDRYRRK